MDHSDVRCLRKPPPRREPTLAERLDVALISAVLAIVAAAAVYFAVFIIVWIITMIVAWAR